MRQAVRDAWMAFTIPLEGLVGGFMYLDVRGLVTTDIGILIDPVDYAVPWPWLHADGSPATQSEIRAEWTRIKGRQDMRNRGGMAYKSIATLHLSPASVQNLVMRKLEQNDHHLASRFARFDEWCADAQLGLLSLAWAVGPGFDWPMLIAAIRAANWRMAAIECQMRTTGNPGVAPRNRANRILFLNADHVQRNDLDPSVLYYPHDFSVAPDPPKLPSIVDSEPEETVIHDRAKFLAAMRDAKRDDGEGA